MAIVMALSTIKRRLISPLQRDSKRSKIVTAEVANSGVIVARPCLQRILGAQQKPFAPFLDLGDGNALCCGLGRQRLHSGFDSARFGGMIYLKSKPRATYPH